jgi:ElaB/YqjD/DUF883 family membrane-anchored ribosome-binding protein
VDNELEVIHHQMEGTRQSLAAKLDTLENQVLGTVQNATAAVANTVEDVKSAVGSVTETIQDTVESVKETFNLKEQVRRHPWPMLGGAAAAGFLSGWLLGSSRKETERPAAPSAPPPPFTPQAREKEDERSSAKEESIFAEPFAALKGIALGAVMGLVRDMAVNALPENVKDDVVQALDSFTAKLGGKPLPGGSEVKPREEPTPQAKEGHGNGKHTLVEAAASADEGKPDSKLQAGQAGRKRGNSRFR